MEVVVLILKFYMVWVMLVMSIYTIRHLRFTLNRLRGEQRIHYQDIVDDELPTLAVLVPMHNEEQVAQNILELLLKADYPADKLEIIPINDHSDDKTAEILDKFAAKHSLIHPLHRTQKDDARGKPAALNDAMAATKSEIIAVFDADYLPPRHILKAIAVSFKDPEVGAVMGRVIPVNVSNGFLPRCIDLERIGGYQVDQQARHNLRLIPQYGGTVGGFRRDVAERVGGFDLSILTEDTELTYKIFLEGYKVVYANRAECYEEVPEDWDVRARQVRRWAHGHTQVMYRYLFKVMGSRQLTFWEKVDGVLLLTIYAVPIIMLTGIATSLALFFLGEMNIIDSALVFIYVAAFNSYGNFAPFYQIGSAVMLDGVVERILLVPYLVFNFFFNLWYISNGFLEGTFGLIFKRRATWDKTKRFRRKGELTQ